MKKKRRTRSSRTSPLGRLSYLDQFRGLAVLLMVMANALANDDSVPACFKHAPGNGLTAPDIVLPLFLLAIGFSAELSFRRRLLSAGTGKTAAHVLARNAVLIIFGSVGTVLLKLPGGWGVLEALGAVGILTLPLFFVKPAVRIILSGFLLAAFQIFMASPAASLVSLFLPSGLGGPAGTFAWQFILVSGSCLSFLTVGRKPADQIIRFAGTGLIAVVAGLSLSVVLPLNKHLVSASYVLLTTGIGAWVLGFLMVLTERFRFRMSPLEHMGKNALVLYMVSNLFILLENALIPPSASPWLAYAGMAVVLIMTWLTGFLLDRFRITIRL